MAILQSTSITGSLEVTGSLNVTEGITGNTTISGSLGVTGSIEVSNPLTSSQYVKIEYNQSDDYRTRLTIDGPRIGTWDGGGEIMLRRSVNNPGDAGTLLLSAFGSTGDNTPHIQSSGTEIVFADSLNPNSNGGYDLGSLSRRWKTLWGNNLDIKSISTTIPTVTISGSNSLTGNYALKIVNSSGTDILAVQNDGKVSINGNFNIISPSKNRNSVNVTDSEIKFLLGDNSNDNQAITITRDESTSTDVVALKVGSDIKIKRNGGGTPTFDINNAGFVYTQNYNGNSVANSNPFNNGAGMGVRNTTQGSPVILSLLINGVFGAGNTAGSALNICNPNGFSSGEGVGLYNLDQAVYFRNTSLFQVSQGPQSGSNAKDIIRNQVANTDSITDYRHGLQLSSTPNVGVSSNNGRAVATNGSPIIDVAAAGVTMRGFLKVGQVVYIHEGWTTSILNSAKPKFYTITNIDSGNGTFTINSNWTGDTGNVSCWLEDTISVIRNYNGNERFRFYGDGTLRTQSNLISLGYITASTYYGDGSNLTGINSGSWDGIFTGSAVITGSLVVQSSEIDFTSLPTTDPGVAGRLFQTSSEAIGASAGFQVVCISQG
jgi:hypothetical protein